MRIHLTSQDLEDPKKIQNLREKGRTFFRTIIDSSSTDTLENIIQRREAAGAAAEAAALRESLELYRGIQRKLESFPPEERELVLELLDTVSEEVYLSACGCQET